METDAAADASPPSAFETVSAERDRLREALERAEAANVALHDEAQAAMQVKADFMARMTHELRTPLSAIIGLAHLAIPLVQNPRVRDYLDKITSSATGLLGVVDDITDFARLEKGLADLVPVPFDLAGALTRVAGHFAPAAGDKGLVLDVVLDPRLPMRLVGDNARLEGVLGQLVGNAVKFTEQGGVKMAVDLVWRQSGRVRLAFAVSDTGVGMDHAAIPAMLESFTQADGSLSRPYGGTGLGLALVRRGAQLLGGELKVESQPGRGSRFFFEATFEEDMAAVAELPSAPTPAAQPSAPPSVQPSAPPSVQPPAPPSGTRTAAPRDIRPATGPLADTLLLLVEDNAINQQVAREVLERFGAAVDVADNGREAVEMVKMTLYDAVLMDVQMPVLDGLGATRAIRLLPGGGDLPIVALTAHALAEDRQRCLEAGMNDYLTKPIDPDRLLSSLGQWIAPAAAAAKASVARDEPRQERTPAGPPPAGTTDAVPQPVSRGLDTARALERLGGNDRLLLSIAAEFVRDYATSCAGITERVAAGDLDGARRLAHTVKGVAGNIAAEALAVAARELEVCLGQGHAPSPAMLSAYAAALADTVEAASRLAPPSDEPPECSLAGCWKVLLVDDAKLNRAIFSQILRSAGHEVVTAINGKDACRLLFGQKAAGRPFDCILMDIEMPEMDGPAATRLIRRLLAASVSPPCALDVPIVALTSHDVEAEASRCLEAGMNACLHKMFERGALLAALGRIMDGRLPHVPTTFVTPIPRQDIPAMGAIMRRLAGHLAVGSIQADEDMEALQKAFFGHEEGASYLEALSRSVERYDFVAALDALRLLAIAAGVELAGIAPAPPASAGMDDLADDTAICAASCAPDTGR